MRQMVQQIQRDRNYSADSENKEEKKENVNKDRYEDGGYEGRGTFKAQDGGDSDTED